MDKEEGRVLAWEEEIILSHTYGRAMGQDERRGLGQGEWRALGQPGGRENTKPG